MKNFRKSAVVALFTLALATLGATAQAGKPGFEKCQGIVKAGMNDCGTAKHACAGMAKTDGDAEEWVFVPEGTCAKLAGGTVKK